VKPTHETGPIHVTETVISDPFPMVSAECPSLGARRRHRYQNTRKSGGVGATTEHYYTRPCHPLHRWKTKKKTKKNNAMSTIKLGRARISRIILCCAVGSRAR